MKDFSTADGTGDGNAATLTPCQVYHDPCHRLRLHAVTRERIFREVFEQYRLTAQAEESLAAQDGGTTVVWSYCAPTQAAINAGQKSKTLLVRIIPRWFSSPGSGIWQFILRLSFKGANRIK
jgi:hypothetical protein